MKRNIAIEKSDSFLNQEFFTILTEDEIDLLFNNLTPVTNKIGDIIIKNGTFVSEFIFIRDGLTKKVIETGNYKNCIIDIILPSSFIVLPLVNYQQIYPFSIIAIKPTISYHIHIDVFKKIFCGNLKAFYFFSHIINQDYLLLHNRISAISTLNNYGKLASSLLYLNSQLNKCQDIFQYITRKDIAELSCISLESANKILADLKHERIIDIKGSNISILKIDLIEKLSMVG
jgi:CRP/FNR family transcriptional regulator, polysaccharide utilization system transcription regulator